MMDVYAIVAVAKTSTAIGAGLWLPDSTNTWHEVTAFSSEAKFDDPQMSFSVWVGGFRLNLGSETSGSLNLAKVLPIDGLQGKVDQGMANVAATKQKVDNWWNGLTQREQPRRPRRGCGILSSGPSSS
jgi:hypothetical protein